MNDSSIKQSLTSDEIMMIQGDFPDVTFSYLNKQPKILFVSILIVILAVYILFEWQFIILFGLCGISYFYKHKKDKNTFFSFLQLAHKISVYGQVKAKYDSNLIVILSLPNNETTNLVLPKVQFDAVSIGDYATFSFLEKNSHDRVYFFYLEKHNEKLEIDSLPHNLEEESNLSTINLGYSEEPLTKSDKQTLRLTEWVRIKRQLFFVVIISLIIYPLYNSGSGSAGFVAIILAFLGLIFVFGLLLNLFYFLNQKKAKTKIIGTVLAIHCWERDDNPTQYSINLDIGVINNSSAFELRICPDLYSKVAKGDYIEIEQVRDFDIYLNVAINHTSISIDKLSRIDNAFPYI